MAGVKTKHFTFNDRAGDVYVMAADIIAHIIQQASVTEEVQATLKMIVVELLTNAIKHSGNADTKIVVDVNESHLIITKTDYGNGFMIRIGNNLLEWPLPGIHHSGSITIYNSGNTSLKAEIKDNCNLRFFIEETEATGPIDINSISEHFGLMIIAQASDSFTYSFNIENCSNNFIISVALSN